jgi:hypothetical protein
MVLMGDIPLFVRNWGGMMGCRVVSNRSVGNSRALFVFPFDVSRALFVFPFDVSRTHFMFPFDVSRALFVFPFNVGINTVLSMSFLGSWLNHWGCFRLFDLSVREVPLPMVVLLVVLFVVMLTVFTFVVVAFPVPLERVRVLDVIF